MKKIICMILAVVICLSLVACGNQQLFDTTFTFESAQVKMPDGSVVEGKVSSWKDYDDSDAVQLVIDGKTYYTHLSNVVLISD